MRSKNSGFYGKQAVIFSNGIIPQTSIELLETDLFRDVLGKYLDSLRARKSSLMKIFPSGMKREEEVESMRDLLVKLATWDMDEVGKKHPEDAKMLKDPYKLNEFCERLYNFWRNYERFIICYSDNNHSKTSFDKRPYRTFNDTIELLNDLVRKVYRDVGESITGDHPRIYRQVAAGCHVGVIVTEKQWPCPDDYKQLTSLPIIRQVYISPPMILDPPMNKRVGFFKKVDSDPLKGIKFDNGEWLCYPAKVCDTLINIFFHVNFIGLGTSLANLFELADEKDLMKKPDAIYAYGVPLRYLKKFGDPPTVFYDDEKNDMLVAAIPGNDIFGYFGYCKKMVLTLHNSVSIKKGRFPVHGAMVKVSMKNGKSANVILWGDTGAGKSESLEAFRVLGDKYIKEMTIIFDDMGSLEIQDDGKMKAYGTETGAFVRLDDLQPGFAFGNMDRAIIHSPQKINARAVLPVTTLEEVTAGYPVDYVLYANNYENVDSSHRILERFDSVEKSLGIFRESLRMAKGTTGETGITNSFFANPFGPLQYKEKSEKLARKYFKKMFENRIFVGQLRTRLGIPGYETKGPQESAKELFRMISES